VTGSLIIASRAWMSRKFNSSTDASTSMSEMRLRGKVRDLKPASLSFRDEKTRWEWPRRRTPPCRRARRTPWREVKKHEIKMRENYEGQASWGECDRQEGSEQLACPREWKKYEEGDE
jgi:hypothetical protein